MTLESGACLGHYRILGLLGRGGMADVYRAEDERLGREVALKLMPPEFARDPDRVERFEREVRAAAKLTHSNIVTVHEFGREGEQPFYTMALMRGGDLKARIRSHPEGMPPEEAREIALAVVRALAYAHEEGFVHRDVKPENILFGQDGIPQLADFGIARAMSSGTRMTATGMSIGSPHYMSPEQARGQAVDGRSDLYSLGVVLYEMLTGKVPFDAADTLAVALRHLNDPVPPLPEELAAWQSLLDRLLAKSPADRYGTAGELADVLGSAALPQVSETRAGAVPETPLAPPGTRVISGAREVGRTAVAKEIVLGAVEASSSRHGLLAVAAGGVLALTVVGILYSMSREDPDRLSSGDSEGAAAARTAKSSNTPSPAGSGARNRRASAGETPVLRLAAAEEQALGLDRAAREEVQAGLKASGFDPGTLYGVFNSRTRAALREWQAVRGKQATGFLDAEGAAVLRAEGAPVLRAAGEAEERAYGLDRAKREEVQAGLIASGFDPGTADGVFGSRTRDALRAWQHVWGKPATGYLDAESAAALSALARQHAEREAEAWQTPPGFPSNQVVSRFRTPSSPIEMAATSLVEPDDVAEPSVRELQLLAMQGSAAAQADVGFRYFTGHGVKRDDAEAVRWYRLAAEQGHARAQNELGVMYLTGSGVEQDDAEAARWYRLAAEGGHRTAQHNLGDLYESGSGVERDFDAAARWFRLSAEQGFAAGQYRLGQMYERGRGVEQDDAEAVRWYRSAAEQGDAGAQNELGVRYLMGHGVDPDDAEAARWFRLAAQQGHRTAQHNLGDLHESGIGVERDFGAAARWFRLSAEQGFAAGQYRLGQMYERGRGVEQDDAEAVRWYRLAAEQGYKEAQTGLDRLR